MRASQLVEATHYLRMAICNIVGAPTSSVVVIAVDAQVLRALRASVQHFVPLTASIGIDEKTGSDYFELNGVRFVSLP